MLNPGCTNLRRARGVLRGLSIVEMMIGLALGLFIVGGAVSMFVSNMAGSRQLLLEARVNQDMRAAADLIVRDLRRAGYWGSALSGTVAGGAASVTTTNPYRSITTGTGLIEYNISRDATEDNTLSDPEYFGFRRTVVIGVGVIQMKVGRTGGVDNWQTVTDPQTIDVTAFTVTRQNTTESSVDVRTSCAKTCCTAADVAAATAGCTTTTLTSGTCPKIDVRHYTLVLTANATGNTTVSRTLSTRVRARNDEFSGTCPS